MIAVCFDAGSKTTGLAIVRGRRETPGIRFACLRHELLQFALGDPTGEEGAIQVLLEVLEWVAAAREPDEPVLVVVEGVEGVVYAGRAPAALFSTADQAGGIRMAVRMWRRFTHDVVQSVIHTTATNVRRCLFGSARKVGDTEVVIAMQACVENMPPMPVPVPSSSSKAYAAMHAYDATAVGVATLAEAMGVKRFVLPNHALAEIAKHRLGRSKAKAERAARKAVRAVGLSLPRGRRQ